MAATPGGWPYVVPSDHPLEYPTVSQQLATLLESSHAAPSEGLLVPAAGWVDYGGVFAGLYASRVGNLVALEGHLKRTSDLAVTAGQYYTMATAPAGFLPVHSVNNAAVANNPQAYGSIVRLIVSAAGSVQFAPSATGTFATGQWVAFSITYRAA